MKQSGTPTRMRAFWRRRRRDLSQRFFPRIAHIPGNKSCSGRSIGRPPTIGVPANAEILFDRRGAAGLVTLNRPQALNAVTHDMVRNLAQMLAAWADDGAVTCVIVTAA